MSDSQFDVVVVGAGAAGMTAAIGLAQAGFSVVVLEAAAFPGAENWSGCVYFCENLALTEILGRDGVEALAWERRLVERGFYATDGHSLLGMKYRDAEAFQYCYTVLRPIFDHHISQVGLRHGVALMNETTAESLIRDQGRIIGVCTNRGPVYGKLVFLAEGDASNLVTCEGYERFADTRESAEFLQGIKQVIEMPEGAIEEIFQVRPEEGVAYEMLIRNATLRGRDLHLNMGGFVYTNRQSLSVGMVLPVANLNKNFGGDPNLLTEWFEQLPALERWLNQGRRGAFGAKLIRGGGFKDIPNLIDDGLAIGGAASAVGIDFPYPNFTGPATHMGVLITRAARRIRAERGSFTRDELERYYLQPLKDSHYWQDVEFLKRWPGYVKRTTLFFDGNIDLALGSAYVWTSKDRWLIQRWFQWVRLLAEWTGTTRWRTIWHDLRHLMRALRFRDIVDRPSASRLLLDGTVNALRDLFRQPRAHLPAAGKLELVYLNAEIAHPAPCEAEQPPALLRRWFRRFSPVLASAARRVYANDALPLLDKLPKAIRLLIRQVNVVDLLAIGAIGIAALLSALFLVGWRRLCALLRLHTSKTTGNIYDRYLQFARRASDLTPVAAAATQNWEIRLAELAYRTTKNSHIHLFWPREIPRRNKVIDEGLWHVCPAHVYEARPSAQGQVQIVVNYENCIKCETCWRSSNLVNWVRDGAHRFTYPVQSPVLSRLLDELNSCEPKAPRVPNAVDYWESDCRSLADGLAKCGLRDDASGRFASAGAILIQLEQKLAEFAAALNEEPRMLDETRIEYFELLARYARQLAARCVELVRLGSSACPDTHVAALQPLLALAAELLAQAEARVRRITHRQIAWAAANGRQMRHHHIAGLRRMLSIVLAKSPSTIISRSSHDSLQKWRRADDRRQKTIEFGIKWTGELNEGFGHTSWREREKGLSLTPEQDALLRRLIRDIPRLDCDNLATSLHPPARKTLLAELGRLDPSLAIRVAAHLWARDLATLTPAAAALTKAADRWLQADEWATFVSMTDATVTNERCNGAVMFVPVLGAESALILLRDRLIVLPARASSGLTIESLATLGLRGAGIAHLRFENYQVTGVSAPVDGERIHRAWKILSCADLTSIALGMADHLFHRATDHAQSRVQFPGLFHDDEARDSIGKFGAVKKMLAEIAAQRAVIETLDWCLSPEDFSGPTLEKSLLVKAIVSEALGSAPGSVSYNAGQVFGGTGYSEDDILSKNYRDASAWRVLGPVTTEILLGHGRDLIRHWTGDETKLTGVADEGILFEQLTQRQALQAELDSIRNLRSRVRAFLSECQQGSASGEWNDSRVDEAAEMAAHCDAHLFASKALVLRTHAAFETGGETESLTATLRVWLQIADATTRELDVHLRRSLSTPRVLVESAETSAVANYSDYLAHRCPYDSGDFLHVPFDARLPRFVPEMTVTDAKLAEADRVFRALLSLQFGHPRRLDDKTQFRSWSYERYIEMRHRPDPEDLDYCRKHGFFRMPIPKELGGEGRSKAEYYLLTTNAQRMVDVAISLTIQANTSIGTTPVLLARDKDLPRAQSDLALFVGEPTHQLDIAERLSDLHAIVARAAPAKIDRTFRKLQKYLEEVVFARSAQRVLMQRFSEAWLAAGRAGKAMDFHSMQTMLQKAVRAWQDGCARAEGFHGEIIRRREACDLFLRWVSAGQISAFALTEPSAGSDTARVATRARLRSARVEGENDNVYRFTPAGCDSTRVLLDAQQLVFRADGVFYRWSASAEPAQVRFDEYDYETDDPDKKRYFLKQGRKVYFTDVAQLRERDGCKWYDYWELSGAKMWITNGRMAGVMCLYAKIDDATVSGVTGFMVDRHAEGLTVGKDEAKMGQCGSPTNELSLVSVRVPRENVIGLEGRGQVNALETLNVGRAGLAMSAMAQMAGLIESSCEYARNVNGELPGWVAWRLARMQAIQFLTEALAFDVIGRFEHPQTRSVRMESAIAKMISSELLHEVIAMAEDVHGPAGQTQLHLVEKRKRDARILNIYEGANEVQRSAILKDLAAEVAPRWSNQDSFVPTHNNKDIVEFEKLKCEFRKHVDVALAFLGPELWQNPSLQTAGFLLAEAAAWLKAADSTLARMYWRRGRPPADSGMSADTDCLKQAAGQALERCFGEVRVRIEQFASELRQLCRGCYSPAIRAGSLLLHQSKIESQATAVHESQIARPISILVVIEPTVAHLPKPVLFKARIHEPHWTMSAPDGAALETALRLRDIASVPVTIAVAAVGPLSFAKSLYEAVYLGVDHVCLIETDTEAFSADSAATGLVRAFGAAAFDLILTGAGGNSEDGLQAVFAAPGFSVPYLGRAARVMIDNKEQSTIRVFDAIGHELRSANLPACVSIEAGPVLRSFQIQDCLKRLTKTVEIKKCLLSTESRSVVLAAPVHSRIASDELAAAESTPQHAARVLLTQLGMGGRPASRMQYEGELHAITSPRLGSNGPLTIVAIIAAEADGRLAGSAATAARYCHTLARSFRLQPEVLLICSVSETEQRRALGQLEEWYSGDVTMLAADDGLRTKRELLTECSDELNLGAKWIIGESWCESVLAHLRGQANPAPACVFRAHQIQLGENSASIVTNRYAGKVMAWHEMRGTAAAPYWVTLAADAISEPLTAVDAKLRVRVWSPPLSHFYVRADVRALLADVKRMNSIVRLAEADFIIDVGFGVGNRDGYEEVVTPLTRALHAVGVRNIVIGGSRKVTEELQLLPSDRQIGQSGVSVNPQILLAVGVSGAPQHLNYIGPRAVIVAFNRDPEAPIMTLNQRQARPRVFPVVGDLFETIPALIAALEAESMSRS